MKIDSIKNGIVIDHITAGKSMELYRLLHLDTLDCPVALIQNAASNKSGKKDIIKIDGEWELNLDVLGFADSGVTVNIIQDGKIVEKITPPMPQTLENVLFCKNPRCITGVEQELPHIFKLTDPQKRIYRCLYCESKA
ncbi:MAG: aspartate carbamoyltransferase regulatory subunit [Ruminococcaceae bacterium]|nr:aspartate carbamoyltransferase regulatory subunit [Oscillospiraceae bacterium]